MVPEIFGHRTGCRIAYPCGKRLCPLRARYHARTGTGNGGTPGRDSWYATDIKGELVTPTGAALVKVLAHAGVRPKDFVYDTVAYGAGTKDLTIPNVVRGFIGQVEEIS